MYLLRDGFKYQNMGSDPHVLLPSLVSLVKFNRRLCMFMFFFKNHTSSNGEQVSDYEIE